MQRSFHNSYPWFIECLNTVTKEFTKIKNNSRSNGSVVGNVSHRVIDLICLSLTNPKKVESKEAHVTQGKETILAFPL